MTTQNRLALPLVRALMTLAVRPAAEEPLPDVYTAIGACVCVPCAACAVCARVYVW